MKKLIYTKSQKYKSVLKICPILENLPEPQVEVISNLEEDVYGSSSANKQARCVWMDLPQPTLSCLLHSVEPNDRPQTGNVRHPLAPQSAPLHLLPLQMENKIKQKQTHSKLSGAAGLEKYKKHCYRSDWLFEE